MRNSEMQSEVRPDMAGANNSALSNEAYMIMIKCENAVHKAAAEQGNKPGIIEIPAVVATSDNKPAYTSWASEMVFGHQYSARPGDDLHLVAKRSLGVSGHPTASEREIRREMARILDLNRDQLPHGFRSHDKLPVALCLRLQADQSVGVSEQPAAPRADAMPIRADAATQPATPAADMPLRADAPAQQVAPAADMPLRADAPAQQPATGALDLTYRDTHPLRADSGVQSGNASGDTTDQSGWGRPLRKD